MPGQESPPAGLTVEASLVSMLNPVPDETAERLVAVDAVILARIYENDQRWSRTGRLRAVLGH